MSRCESHIPHQSVSWHASQTPKLLLCLKALSMGVPAAGGGSAAECGGGEFLWTTNPEKRTQLWKAPETIAVNT